MQTAGGIDEQHVHPPGGGRLDGIEDNRRRIRAWRLVNHLDADPFSPRLELLDGGGAERICGGQQDALTVGLELRSQLRACRGFSGPVDAEHENDARPMR